MGLTLGVAAQAPEGRDVGLTLGVAEGRDVGLTLLGYPSRAVPAAGTVLGRASTLEEPARLSRINLRWSH